MDVHDVPCIAPTVFNATFINDKLTGFFVFVVTVVHTFVLGA